MVAAAKRKTPTVGNGGARDGTDYLNSVDAEVENLWTGAAFGWLINVAGTGNAVTATSDTTVVAAITAYSRPMAFWYAPATSNTSAVTINIDAVGIINVKDQFGSALAGGEFLTTGVYPIVFDGTNFRAATVTAGAANRPTTTPDIIAQEQQSTGTSGHNGATFTSGAYRQRELTILVRNNNSLGSLASNQVTLPAGTYYARWSCPAATCGAHKTRLYNATTSAVIALGSSEYTAASANYAVTRSIGSASFTLTASTAIEIDHRCATTATGDGFGEAASFGDTEVYTTLEIWKQ